MSDRPEIARRIAEAQDAILDQLDATRGQRRARFVAAARRPTRSPTNVPWVAVGGAVAAAAVVALLWVAKTPPDVVEPPSADRVASTTEPDSVPRTLVLEGGATLTIAETSEVSVPSATEPRVVLARGTVSLTAARSAAPAQIEAGDFVVVGDRSEASVQWSPDEERLAVSVQSGQVVVRRISLGTQQVVVAGQSVQLSTVEVTRGPTVEAPKEPESIEPESTQDAPLVPRPRRARPSWKELAAEGEHAAAVAPAEAKGFGRIVKTAKADELLALARAARYAKSPSRATEALQAVRKRFPRTRAAAQAAYALGRVAFDAQRKFAVAATWFQTYLDEQPKGALKREALGRLVESHRRSGAGAAAKRAARKYLDSYPDGPHADIARQAL